MKDLEFEELLNSYCNGTISPEDSQKLEQELLENPERRDFYNSFMNLDAALKEEAEGSPAEILQAPQGHKASKNSFWIAAIILLSLNLFFIYLSQSNNTIDSTAEEPLQTGLALITNTLDVDSEQNSLGPGMQLEAGHLEFKSGIIQIEMFSGATILVQGPAKLELQDSMLVKLYHGKIRCRIPNHAKGFTVATDELSIIDLGTEFSLIANLNSSINLYVHEGEVLVNQNSTGNTLASVKKDEGYSWIDQKLSHFQLGPNEISFQQLAELNKQQNQNKFHEWQNFAKTLRQREDVILFYSFQNSDHSSRTVSNESLNKNPNLNGSIVGAQWTKGRWPHKSALTYSSTGDRIRLNIPGTYEAVTFSCWVKIHSFDRWLSSLLLTDNYDRGELHWQLSDSGEMILGASGNGNTFSKPLIGPKDLGRWIHLATSYNPTKGEVTHFLDGKLVQKGKAPNNIPIKMGKADIGNWTTMKGHDHALRSLNGTLDEFIIFSKALNEEQIKEIYVKGRPE